LTAVNYTGTGGQILLNTYLGGDGSPSDRLIINGGTATGSTGLFIHNTTGQGAETTGNGILVVNAINGGTTIPGAFMLTGEVRGGAFDYDLFRGGLGGSAPNDWFLRSSFVVPPGPATESGNSARPAAGNLAARRLADHRTGACDLWRRAADRATARPYDVGHAARAYR
jgi:outer membrane autotransporter protein